MKSIFDNFLLVGTKCTECGNLIIAQANNTQLAAFEGFDYIYYCANVECDKHFGEGVDPQERPTWIVSSQ